MRPASINNKEVPINIVGSSTFGRYPKISEEHTYNMFVSDKFLVDFAGYQQVSNIEAKEGRGIYASTRLGKMIVVSDDSVFTVDSNLFLFKVGSINSSTGNVFIAENNASQIAICDQRDIWIYNYVDGTFQKASIDFIPGYIEFQDSYFISVDTVNAKWRLSTQNNGLSWPAAPQNVGLLQTKPDNLLAAVRVPGKGNLLFIFGETVIESWYDTGAQLFPYSRSSYSNIDYGCLNQATIATNDNKIVWLAANEKSGPVIMVSEGGNAIPISTDGINYKFASLTNPGNSYGFLFKQDGHLFYQISFPDDNLSYAYDFNTNKFYDVCDVYMNMHIAKKVAFFNDTYYFISFVDGNIYELNSKYTTFNGAIIPRGRIPGTFRLPDNSRFIVNNLTLVMEQGEPQPNQDPTLPRIDLSLSKNGGQTFGSYVSKTMNRVGNRRNRVMFWDMGQANEITYQLRFWGTGRFVVGDGVMSYYQ